MALKSVLKKNGKVVDYQIGTREIGEIISEVIEYYEKYWFNHDLSTKRLLPDIE